MNHTEFFQSLKDGTRPVYLFYGEESYVRRSALNRLAELLLPEKSLREVNMTVLPSLATAEDVCTACETVPFLAQKRLVVAENFSMLRSEAKPAEEKRMASYLENPAPDTVLVFYCTEVPERRKKFFKQLQPCAVEFAPLGEQELNRWLGKLLRRCGKTASPAVLQFLAEYTDARPEALCTEVEKLAAYVGQSTEITREDVTRIVTPGREYSVFRMTDAMLRGDRKTSLTLLDGLLRQREEPLYILGAVSKQYRQLLRLFYYRQAKTPQAQVLEETGMRDFVYRKLTGALSSFNEDALLEAVSLCSRTDEGLKTGKAFDFVALQTLLVRLCGLVKQRR